MAIIGGIPHFQTSPFPDQQKKHERTASWLPRYIQSCDQSHRDSKPRHRLVSSRRANLNGKASRDIQHGSLNVPIEHHPTIRYMVYNGYYKVMSNSPKMGHLPIPVQRKTYSQILGFGNVPFIQGWTWDWNVKRADKPKGFGVPIFRQIQLSFQSLEVSPQNTWIWTFEEFQTGT